MSKDHIGSDFDDFLKQDGLLAECEASALKRVVASQEMEKRASRGTQEGFDEFMKGVPDVEPEDYDKLPKRSD